MVHHRFVVFRLKYAASTDGRVGDEPQRVLFCGGVGSRPCLCPVDGPGAGQPPPPSPFVALRVHSVRVPEYYACHRIQL